MSLMHFIKPKKFEVGDKVLEVNRDLGKAWNPWVVLEIKWDFDAWMCKLAPGYWVNEQCLERV